MKNYLLVLMVSIFAVSCSNLNEVGSPEESSNEHQLDYSSLLEDKGDYYLYDNCIRLYIEDEIHKNYINELKTNSVSSRGCKMKSTLTWNKWGKGVVRYVFMDVDESTKNLVKRSIKIIESVCDVKYEDYTGKISGNNYDYYYRIYKSTSSSISSSTLGQGRISVAHINRLASLSNVIHELLHGLGMHHEQVRWDAYKYVTFNKENLVLSIDPSNYEPADKDECETYGDYDYLSIMHYEKDAGGENVLVAKNGSDLGGNNLSRWDKYTLRELYGKSKHKHKVYSGNFVKNGSDNKKEIIIINGDVFELRGTDGNIIKMHVSGDQIRHDSLYLTKTWIFDFKKDKFRVGDFDGDGLDDLLVTSDWGLGVISPDFYNRLETKVFAKNRTWFGSWCFDSKNDEILEIADFDGEPGDEILIKSAWGLGLLKYDNGTFRSLVCKPNKASFDGWRYDKDHKILGVGDFNGDDKKDFLIQSDWGLGILSYKGNGTFDCYLAKPFGSRFRHWAYYKGQQLMGTGNFDGIKGDEILIVSNWGVGILKLTKDENLTSIMCKPYSDLDYPLSGQSFSNKYYPNSCAKNGYRNEIKFIGDLYNKGRDYIMMNRVNHFYNSQLQDDYLFYFDGSTLKLAKKGLINSILRNYTGTSEILGTIDMTGDGTKSLLVYDPFSDLQIHSMKTKYPGGSTKLFCTHDYY